MSKLLLTPLARKDLQDIKKYIASELQNPQAAINTVVQITKKFRSLTDFPNMGTNLAAIVNIGTDYRFLICGNYTVFYRYEAAMIYVIRVLYSRRDFMQILFGERQGDNIE